MQDILATQNFLHRAIADGDAPVFFSVSCSILALSTCAGSAFALVTHRVRGSILRVAPHLRERGLVSCSAPKRAKTGNVMLIHSCCRSSFVWCHTHVLEFCSVEVVQLCSVPLCILQLSRMLNKSNALPRLHHPDDFVESILFGS